MGVGSVSSMNSMSNLQTTMAGSTDVKSKNIQNEINDIQQQMQKVSSQEELSVDEKADERKKLQKEISSLNTELERHQEEFLRSQKREIMMAELQENEKPEEEEKAIGRAQTDEAGQEDADNNAESIDSNTAEQSRQDTSVATSATQSAQQTGQPGTVIVKNSDGIVILKGEMNPVERSDVDADETGEEDVAEEETENVDTDTGLSHKEMNAMVSANVSAQQASRQGTVIARINGDVAILKGEMSLDEKRGQDTDRKQEQLEKLEEKEEKARIFQFSVLGEANKAMETAAKAEDSGMQISTDNNAFINASKLSQEEEQKFYVSFG